MSAATNALAIRLASLGFALAALSAVTSLATAPPTNAAELFLVWASLFGVSTYAGMIVFTCHFKRRASEHTLLAIGGMLVIGVRGQFDAAIPPFGMISIIAALATLFLICTKNRTLEAKLA